MEKLIRGLLSFRQNELPKLRDKFAELAKGQNPTTLFMACADSRVVPNLLVGVANEPGQLFTIRTVGNLISPNAGDGRGKGDVSEAGAVEYALLVLGVKDIVICGHSKCGAMAALCNGTRNGSLAQAPNLIEWLEHGAESLRRVGHVNFIDKNLPKEEQLSQVNVLQQLDHLRTYPFVAEREARGEVTLHGWWFDVATGDTHVYDSERGGFVLLDEAEAQRILEHIVPSPRLVNAE